MIRLFLIGLLTLSLIELFGLIAIGSWIGALPTIALCIGTAMLGSFLVRREGIRTYRHAIQQFFSGQVPGYTVLEGFVILASGVFLMFPGFISDLIGLFLIVPWTRRLVVDILAKYLTKKLTDAALTQRRTNRIYVQNHAE